MMLFIWRERVRNFEEKKKSHMLQNCHHCIVIQSEEKEITNERKEKKK